MAAALAVACCACSNEPSAPRPRAERRDAGPVAAVAAPAEQLIVTAKPRDRSVAEVERTITAPIEDALAQVSSVTELRSLSSRREVRIAVRIEAGTDGAAAARDAAEALRRASLPDDLKPPLVARRTDGESLRWTVSSPTMSAAQMRGVREHRMQSLSRIGGVANMSTCGAVGDEVVRLWIDPDQMKARGLDLAGLEAGLARVGGSGVPAFKSLAELAKAPLTTGTAPIAVGDVAQVERGALPADCVAYDLAGRPVMSVEVEMGRPVARRATRPGTPPTDDKQVVIARMRNEVDQMRGRIQAVQSGSPGLDLRIELPHGAQPQQMADSAAKLARAAGGLAGVSWVVVETGSTTSAASLPELPGLRARVVVGAPATAKSVVEALEAAVPEAAIRVVSGPIAEVRALVVGDELDLLDKAAGTLAGSLRKLKGVDAAGASTAGPEPRVEVVPDPARLGELGITRDAVDRAVAVALEGAAVARLREWEGKYIPVRVKLGARDVPSSPADTLARVNLRDRSGAMVPLPSVARLELRAEPAAILRVNRRRAVEVWMRLRAGTTQESAIAAAKAVRVEIPAGIEVVWPEPAAQAPAPATSQPPPAPAHASSPAPPAPEPTAPASPPPAKP